MRVHPLAAALGREKKEASKQGRTTLRWIPKFSSELSWCCSQVKFFQLFLNIGSSILFPLTAGCLNFVAHFVQRFFEHLSKLVRHVIHLLPQIRDLCVLQRQLLVLLFVQLLVGLQSSPC